MVTADRHFSDKGQSLHDYRQSYLNYSLVKYDVRAKEPQNTLVRVFVRPIRSQTLSISSLLSILSGDPWFHGPWFVRPGEVEHSPTRMFLEKELFMSNIQDTNPMRSIMGRCSALSLADYCKSE